MRAIDSILLMNYLLRAFFDAINSELFNLTVRIFIYFSLTNCNCIYCVSICTWAIVRLYKMLFYKDECIALTENICASFLMHTVVICRLNIYAVKSMLVSCDVWVFNFLSWNLKGHCLWPHKAFSAHCLGKTTLLHCVIREVNKLTNLSDFCV